MPKLTLMPLSSGAPSTATPIPLDLASLLPKKNSRFDALLLKIGALPARARLSDGRRNGDGSWSVSVEQLVGLNYIPASSDFLPHYLNVRIIGLNEDEAEVVRQVDLRVALDGKTPFATAQIDAGKTSPGKPLIFFSRSERQDEISAANPRLHDQIAILAQRLDEAETEINNLKDVARAASARLAAIETAAETAAANGDDPLGIQTGGGPRPAIWAAASPA